MSVIVICRFVSGDITPADTPQCSVVRACQFPLISSLLPSAPLSLPSSLMGSLQPSPSQPCLIHFPGNSLGALWFICLWSLLTLSNTFPFFPFFSVFPHLSFGRAPGSCEEYQLLCACLITVFHFLSQQTRKKFVVLFYLCQNLYYPAETKAFQTLFMYECCCNLLSLDINTSLLPCKYF